MEQYSPVECEKCGFVVMGDESPSSTPMSWDTAPVVIIVASNILKGRSAVCT